MDEQTRFFFNNIEQVKKVRATEDAAYRFVISQLRMAAEKLNLKFTGASYDYRYFELPDYFGHGVYYTVLFDKLFHDTKTLWVVIELHHQALPNLELIERELDLKSIPGLLYKPNRHADTWLHYVGKSYSFGLNELEDLGDRLADSIQSDLAPIMNKIIEILKKAELATTILEKG